MAVTLSGFPISGANVNISWTMQSHNFGKNLVVNYSTPGNRLYQHSDGSLEIIPKTPAEVIGEKIIKPLIIDTAFNWSSRTLQVIRRGFSFVDHLLSRIINIFPVVKAETPSGTLSFLATQALEKGEQDNKICRIPPAFAIDMLRLAAENIEGHLFAEMESSGEIIKRGVQCEKDHGTSYCLDLLSDGPRLWRQHVEAIDVEYDNNWKLRRLYREKMREEEDRARMAWYRCSDSTAFSFTLSFFKPSHQPCELEERVIRPKLHYSRVPTLLRCQKTGFLCTELVRTEIPDCYVWSVYAEDWFGRVSTWAKGSYGCENTNYEFVNEFPSHKVFIEDIYDYDYPNPKNSDLCCFLEFFKLEGST